MIEYEVVWNGAEGWVGRDQDLGRGALLLPYESKTTLTDAIREGPQRDHRHARNPLIHARAPRGDVQRVIWTKYPAATRDAIRASRADGLTFTRIAERFEVPLTTVYHIVTEDRSQPQP